MQVVSEALQQPAVPIDYHETKRKELKKKI